MKKLIALSFGFALLAAGSTAFAADGYLPASQCHVPPDHGIWSADTTHLVGCITQAAWNAAALAQAQTNVQHLPVIAAGTTFYDAHGFKYVCPWFESGGCYDITHTAKYNADMMAIARVFVANGWSDYSHQLDGWIAAAR